MTVRIAMTATSLALAALVVSSPAFAQVPLTAQVFAPGSGFSGVAAPAALQSPVFASSQEQLRLEAALTRRTRERDRVDAELEGVVHERNNASGRMRSRLRALYRMRRAGVLPLAGGFEALLTHQSRVQRLERMVVRDIGAARELRRRVDALSAESSRLRAEIDENRQRLDALRQQRVAQAQQLDMLSSMIENPTPYAVSQPGFGLRVAGQAPTATGFPAERGRLPLPVAGSARLADATREGGAGLALSASSGVTVRAVYPGRVAYAAAHPAYGRLAIIDHSDGHYTVYGGLGALGVTVGQNIGRDAVLGTVGQQPVFFQVRRGSRPLDARAWLGL